MSKKLKIGIVIILVLIVGIGLAYNFFYGAVFRANVEKDVELFWPEEYALDSIADYFKTENVIKNKNAFVLVAKQKGFTKSKAGHYLIKEGMNNNELVNILMGGLQTPVKVSFIAQPNIKKFCSHISNQLRLDSAELYTSITTYFIQKHNLEEEWVPAYFIPNTYEFYWTVSAEKFCDRMFKEYQSFWNENRFKQAQAIGLTPLEVATLASIVDGETHKKQEMARIAGLYLNRLKKGIKLQSDPTVKYTIKQQKGDDYVIRRVLYADLEIPSPYNTYYTKGLPPGPISIPSSIALKAVLQAEKHNYIYMCANPETGLHDFTSSYREHEQNASKYRAWLKRNNIRR